MQTPGTITSDSNHVATNFGNRFRQIFLRKLWLPRGLYEALPYLYIAVGMLALLSAIFSPGWAWILPYVLLAGLILLHLGLGLVALRYRFRKSRRRPLAPKT